MKVYIAGPMEGLPDNNFSAFDYARDEWIKAGHDVVSPADITRESGNTTRRTAYSDDIPALMGCSAIALLPGWRESKGTLLEIHAAEDVDMPIYDARFPRSPTHIKETIREEAGRLVAGARQGDYGGPTVNFERIAALWTPLFDIAVSPEQVALAMIAVKMARLLNNAQNRDGWVDIAGYAQTGAIVTEVEK